MGLIRISVAFLFGLSVAPMASASAAPAKSTPAKPAPADTSGNVTRAQMITQSNQIFDRADTNHDGFMSRSESRCEWGA